MNSYVNEEVMWDRLKDRQREAEDRRRRGAPPAAAMLLGDAGIAFGRMFAGVFGGRSRRRWMEIPEEAGTASRIA